MRLFFSLWVSSGYLFVFVEVVHQPRRDRGRPGLAHLEVLLELLQLDLRELFAVPHVLAQLLDVVLARRHPGIHLFLYLLGRPDLVDEDSDLAPRQEDGGEADRVVRRQVVDQEDHVPDLPPLLVHLSRAVSVEEVLDHLGLEGLRREVFQGEEENDDEVVQVVCFLELPLLREPGLPRRTGRTVPWTFGSS